MTLACKRHSNHAVIKTEAHTLTLSHEHVYPQLPQLVAQVSFLFLFYLSDPQKKCHCSIYHLNCLLSFFSLQITNVSVEPTVTKNELTTIAEVIWHVTLTYLTSSTVHQIRILTATPVYALTVEAVTTHHSTKDVSACLIFYSADFKNSL